jgi:hypothetical protein
MMVKMLPVALAALVFASSAIAAESAPLPSATPDDAASTLQLRRITFQQKADDGSVQQTSRLVYMMMPIADAQGASAELAGEPVQLTTETDVAPSATSAIAPAKLEAAKSQTASNATAKPVHVYWFLSGR